MGPFKHPILLILHRNNSRVNRTNGNNRRIRFTNTRRVRPISKQGKSRPIGNSHKTRTKARKHANYPDEENVFHMVQSSTQSSRVAKEVADLFASYDTYEEMIHALVEKPMSAHIKSLVYRKLERNAANLRNMTPPRNHVAIHMGNMPPGGYPFNDPRYNVSKDPLYQ